MGTMRFRVLATDYDGTLATHGSVEAATTVALERLKKSGRKVFLVTGRELPDLKKVYPEYAVFDRIVAENGGLLYDPALDEEKLLCEPPAEVLIDRLRELQVPVSVGRAVIATTEPHHLPVLEAIHELGLELQLTFNKGAVMVLPSGVNKATGLGHALREIGATNDATVGVGDAENDHAFLAACGCGVAVANALPSLKSRAQVVTRATHGAGVVEIIDELLANDFVRCAGHGSAH
jgi:hydroxymethylpyrimidine pyrophosphatase-like HAD family hydrolase